MSIYNHIYDEEFVYKYEFKLTEKELKALDKTKFVAIPLPFGGKENTEFFKDYDLISFRDYDVEDEFGGYEEDRYCLYRHKTDKNKFMIRHDNYIKGEGHDYWAAKVELKKEKKPCKRKSKQTKSI